MKKKTQIISYDVKQYWGGVGVFSAKPGTVRFHIYLCLRLTEYKSSTEGNRYRAARKLRIWVQIK